MSIAYQVFGSGEIELLVLMSGAASHLEVAWEEPRMVRIYDRLARFARVVTFDRRGTGLSDPPTGELTLEEHTDDIIAVLRAGGFTQPAFVGGAESGRLGLFAAATHPEWFSALVLVGAAAAGSPQWDPQPIPEFEQIIASAWGSGLIAARYMPSLAGDPRFMRWLDRVERNAASPGMARRLLRLSAGTDLRELLPLVRVTTLVIHRRGDSLIPIDRGRELAARIAGARYVELDGGDNHMIAGDSDAVLDEIEELLTGGRGVPETDTVLVTVLFTDLVDSTRRAAELGDRDWNDLLSAHDRVVRYQLARYRGREIKTLGGGFLATFDGPARAIRCAQDTRRELGRIGLSSRAGIHSGQVL